MVRQYKRKPTTILALKFDGYNLDEIKDFAGSIYMADSWCGDKCVSVDIRTQDGFETAYVGDYIIKTNGGKFATCNGAKFERSYE